MYSIHIPGQTIDLATLVEVHHQFFENPLFGVVETPEVTLHRDGQPLEVIRYNGILTVRQAGSARDIMTRMLAEIRPEWFIPGNRQREPWEIERRHWENFQFAFELAGKPAWVLSFEQLEAEHEAARSSTTRFDLRDTCSAVATALFGYGSEGPRVAGNGSVNGRHEVHVAYALLAGRLVPEGVLQAYRAEPKLFGFGMEWATILAENPCLRGALPHGVLRQLAITMRREGSPVTEESVPALVAALDGLPPNAPPALVDDRLYAARLINAHPLPEKYLVPVNVGKPHSDLADRLRTVLATQIRDQSIARIERDRAEGRMSCREYERSMQVTRLDHGRATFEWPNRFAAAVEQRNIGLLLDVLDSPDDMNRASKQVVHEFLGVKLRRLATKKRRRAIFAMCGMDEAAQSDWETRHAQRKVEAREQRDAEHAKQKAGRARYQRPDGTVVSGCDHVDQAIANGFTEIRAYARGSVKRYAIVNPAVSEGRSLRANDGTLEYARAVLERRAA